MFVGGMLPRRTGERSCLNGARWPSCSGSSCWAGGWARRPSWRRRPMFARSPRPASRSTGRPATGTNPRPTSWPTCSRQASPRRTSCRGCTAGTTAPPRRSTCSSGPSPGWNILPSNNDNYVKLGQTDKLVDGSSGSNGVPPDFAYIGATGWEAAFHLAPGSYFGDNGLNVHAQVVPERPASDVRRGRPPPARHHRLQHDAPDDRADDAAHGSSHDAPTTPPTAPPRPRPRRHPRPRPRRHPRPRPRRHRRPAHGAPDDRAYGATDDRAHGATHDRAHGATDDRSHGATHGAPDEPRPRRLRRGPSDRPARPPQSRRSIPRSSSPR